jgi:hypothetical protein
MTPEAAQMTILPPFEHHDTYLNGGRRFPFKKPEKMLQGGS